MTLSRAQRGHPGLALWRAIARWVVSLCTCSSLLLACSADEWLRFLDGVSATSGEGTDGTDDPESGPPSSPPRATDKLDLLFMIDNSISMSDKQGILRQGVPDLLRRLTNPICLDANGGEQPAPAPGSDCPEGQRRQFSPLADIHVGIVSSSLGDVGANVACPIQGFSKYRPDGVDMAHLLGTLERSRTPGNAHGFLEWRAGVSDPATFNQDLQGMVTDVGENGCGWEASLESWYRFLIDPVPYRALVRQHCAGSSSTAANCVGPATGADGRQLLDDTLLAQRAAFSRDDSLVAIVMLTDENDCSAQVGNQTWVVFNIEDTRPMFRGSSVCTTDPNAPCCYSCPLGPPDGCAADPACTADPAHVNRLSPELDGQNLRCFEQQRRFGIDFLYPTQRYVHALTERQLCPSAVDLSPDGCDPADLYANPLFAAGRSPAQVFLTGIIGVPWQALAADRDAAGQPLSLAHALRLQSYDELTNHGVWDQILGSPGASPPVPPSLPQMVESPQFPRAGVSAGNTLNGRDYDTTQGTATQSGGETRADDLQYACIFPLPAARDCALLDPNTDNCDCYPRVLDRPLCEATPGVSPAGTTQYWGKAYPGVRELQVLKDFGAQTQNSIVASICARNTSDPSQPDFGYRPAMAALMERLQTQLQMQDP